MKKYLEKAFICKRKKKPLPVLLFIYTAEGLHKAGKDVLESTVPLKYPTFNRNASFALVYT